MFSMAVHSRAEWNFECVSILLVPRGQVDGSRRFDDHPIKFSDNVSEKYEDVFFF